MDLNQLIVLTSKHLSILASNLSYLNSTCGFRSVTEVFKLLKCGNIVNDLFFVVVLGFSLYG